MLRYSRIITLTASCIIILLACSPRSDPKLPAAYSLDGQALFAPEPTESLREKLAQYRTNYEQDSTDADHIIWYGRFLAYAGRYRDAINVFTRGFTMFPEDARFLRHRGHRYITLREFAQAVADLETAVKLIKDKPNEIEPDGMPNARNIPVSTLHGNIYYHLGLAYYLQHNFDRALSAYLNCLASTHNDDNLVSATHWIYTIMCRQDPKGDPLPYLESITDSLNVIENQSYHRLCLLHKDAITVDEVRADMQPGASRDAVDYGIARWYVCQGKNEAANEILAEILSHPGWASFGYIAAESDVAISKNTLNNME